MAWAHQNTIRTHVSKGRPEHFTQNKAPAPYKGALLVAV